MRKFFGKKTQFAVNQFANNSFTALIEFSVDVSEQKKMELIVNESTC